jgi:hypothetical protein
MTKLCTRVRWSLIDELQDRPVAGILSAAREGVPTGWQDQNQRPVRIARAVTRSRPVRRC